MRRADLALRLSQSLELDYETADALVRRMVPTLQLEDISDPWTNDSFQIRWASAQKAQAAGGAATYAKVQLSNGYNMGTVADTGVLVVVRQIQIWGDADLTPGIAWALNANEVGSIGADIDFTDLRLVAAGKNPAASVRSGTPAALTSPELWQGVYEHDRRPLIIEFPAILQSGYGLQVQNRIANATMYAAFSWFEVDAPLLSV